MIVLAGCTLSGVDYPYWATFNLQKVFPGLQDKLAVFPVATIYNRLIQDWPGLRPQLALFKKPDLVRKLETLYGSYLVALSKGALPYQVKDRAPKFQTVSFMVQQTGIDRGTVVAFLSTLEKMAKAGGVDLKYWNPDKAVELNKEVAKRIKVDQATAPRAPLVSALSDTAAGLKWGGLGLLALVAAVAVGKIVK